MNSLDHLDGTRYESQITNVYPFFLVREKNIQLDMCVFVLRILILIKLKVKIKKTNAVGALLGTRLQGDVVQP